MGLSNKYLLTIKSNKMSKEIRVTTQEVFGDTPSAKNRRKSQRKNIKNLTSKIKKINYKLRPGAIDQLIWTVGEQLEQAMFDWYQEGGCEEARATEDYHQSTAAIYDHLRVLEDLLPYRLEKDKKLERNTLGDFWLYANIRRARRFVDLPPVVEEYFLAMRKIEVIQYARMPACAVCGGGGANNYHTSGIVTHPECLEKHGWYQCSWCGWPYPKEVEQCRRKYDCAKGKITKCKSHPYPKL